MLQSKLFTKTRKESPADEVSKNGELLIKAGFIEKEMAGVYSYLPLGLRVLKNIERIIREEMNAVGGTEILMPVFQAKERWEKTGRWESMDDLYKVADSSGREVGLGPTHEENVVPLLKQFVQSYRDLPVSVYQIQNKFRMELRAKSGILRGREFLMKDMYSFHTDEADLDAYYEKLKGAYKNIWRRAGIGHVTFLTFASGGSFAKFSHEFQTLTPAGEDTIYIDADKGIAVNKEVLEDEVLAELGINRDTLREERAIEVGNIFKLKTKYSAPFELSVAKEDGEKDTVLMGCYGIGLGRLMGTIVEVLSDDKGMVWPKEVAPFTAHLLILGETPETKEKALALATQLETAGVDVLVDDRAGLSAGEKFADADLIGIPWRIVASDRSLQNGGFEIKKRTEEKGEVVKEGDVRARLLE